MVSDRFRFRNTRGSPRLHAITLERDRGCASSSRRLPAVAVTAQGANRSTAARAVLKERGLRCRNRSETAGCTRRVIRKAPSPAPVMTCAMSTGSAVRGAPARRIDCRSAEPSKSLRRATLADRRRCGQVPVTVRTKSTWSDPGTTDLALPNDVPPRSLLRTQTTWVRRCPP